MYSRPYLTTAADRAIRGERGRGNPLTGLPETGTGGSIINNNNNTLLQPDIQPGLPILGQSHGRLFESEPPRNESLIDMDNDSLQSLLRRTNEILVDIPPQITPPRDVRFTSHLNNISSGGMTQYCNLGLRESRGVPMACSTGRGGQLWNVGGGQPVENQRHEFGAALPSNGPVISSHPLASGGALVTHSNELSPLSKVDRTVVMELIKKVKGANGNDEVQLVNFLKDIRPLFEISPQASNEIIKLLLPCVSGPLFKLWLDAVSQAVSWDLLHTAILDQFIPPLRRREIESLEIDRPQRHNEDFAEYTEAVIGMAFAINTRLTEQEVIDVILNKCHPSSRLHFGFSNPPGNIGELRALATRVASSIKAEQRYFGDRSRQRTHSIVRNSSERPSQSGRGEVKCFRCNAHGHIARNCRQNLNGRKNP